MSEETTAEGRRAPARVVCIASDAHTAAVRDALASALPAAEVVSAERVSLSLQHALANPLTALLAEAQLLELEALDAEQRAAVERVVTLCRRTIEVVRALDVIGAAERGR